ncbi:MAG: dimethyl sulfoxide reductase anchor subunit, partial [Kiritimatiellae bacterium]|nr:dimethyl sulfoxide reductase anchor subunit [Kiritimatiellia bacterium]
LARVVIMLVLTQLSVGTFLWDFIIRVLFKGTDMIGGGLYAGGAFMLGVLALGASVLHLGRPLYAFRAVLGLKTSWLSREIIVFGLYAGVAMLFAASFVNPASVPWLMGPLEALRDLRPVLSLAVALSGVVGVFCSVMVYGVTQRPLWGTPTVGFKFFMTMLVLGLALIWAASSIHLGWTSHEALETFFVSAGRTMCLTVAALASLKLLYEVTSLAHLKDKLHSPARRAAVLSVRELRGVTVLRYGLGLIGGVLLPVLALSGATMISTWMLVAIPLVSFLFLVLGELLERHLFFVTSVAPRMPGGPVV